MKAKFKSATIYEPFEIVKDQLRFYDIKEVSDYSGVHTSTMYSWLEGKTKCPYLRTLIAVAEAIGLEISMKKVKANIRPNVKSVK